MIHQDLHEMNLYPCAYSMTFNVTKEPGQDKLVLNAILNQRSQDILAANNWNVVPVCYSSDDDRPGMRYGGGRAGPCDCRLLIFMTVMCRSSKN